MTATKPFDIVDALEIVMHSNADHGEKAAQAFDDIVDAFTRLTADHARLTVALQAATEEADALQAVGGKLVNLCFNQCTTMRELCKQWDAIPHRSDELAARLPTEDTKR